MQRLSTTPAGESPTVSVRLPPELLAVVDAEAERLRAVGAGDTTRGSAVRALLREVVQLRAAAAPGGTLTRAELAPVLAALDGASARVRGLLDASPAEPLAEPPAAPVAPAPRPPRATPPGSTVRRGGGVPREQRSTPEQLDALRVRLTAALAAGHRQGVIAARAGVQAATVSRIAHGAKAPASVPTLAALAEALDALGA